MTEQKFYVVWKGRKRGVFETWPDCKAQVDRYSNAKHKAFPTREAAERAFKGDYNHYIKRINGKRTYEVYRKRHSPKRIKELVLKSLCVGGHVSSSGIIKYQGMYSETGEQFFSRRSFENGTLAIAQFLAIFHAIVYCKAGEITCPIYSSNRTAIKWIKSKQVKTLLRPNDKNKKLIEHLSKVTEWLRKHDFPNEILYWEKDWDKNPATVGLK